MKVEIFDKKKAPEKVVKLALEYPIDPHEDGVYLVAVDDWGNRCPHGYLLHINQQGFTRCGGVSQDLGFDLTVDKQLPEVEL